MAATVQTTQVPPSTYQEVPLRDAEYSKEQYTTTVPATSGYTTTTTQRYGAPSTTTGPTSYEQLNQAVPGVSIFLRPMAAPSALGWMSFFGATFILFTYYASWYGGNDTYIDIAPFVFTLGICQLISGFYGYKARDNFATVWFPVWGAFYVAWGWYVIYELSRKFSATSPTGVPLIPPHAENDGLGMWFVILTGVSWACFLPALSRDLITGLVVLLAAVGVTLEMAFFSSKAGMRNSVKAGSYFLMCSAVVALIRGGLYLLEESYDSNLTSRLVPQYRHPYLANKSPVVVGVNEPGVKRAQ